MVGVRATRRVNVPRLQHAPAALAGMEENVIQPAPAQQQSTRPAEFVRRAVGVWMQVAERVQPQALGLGDVGRAFLRVEVAANQRAPRPSHLPDPGAQMS